MSFASPLAFGLAAVAIPIVILYILKVRLRRIQVSTNLFWKQIYDERPPRSIWQTLRHLLSLLAQLLLVGLLVLAIADPSLSWQLLQARRMVAVIDASASMRATDVVPSRFDAAMDAALATVEGLRFRDEMAIVLAGPEPEVVIGMSGHVPTLKRALRSIHVTDNPTELDSAIALGQQLIGQHPHGQILVFTDGCGERGVDRGDGRGGQESLADERASRREDVSLIGTPHVLEHPIEYHVFGNEKTGNLGITQFQVRRSLVDPLGYEMLVAVKNASQLALKARLEIELNGIPIDVLPLNLEPDDVFSRTLEKTSLEGGTLVATLTEVSLVDHAIESATRERAGATELNSLATDDQAWAVLPPRETQEVLIVTPGNLFLQKVFEANPLVRVTIQKEFPDQWPTGSIVVLHQNLPDELPPCDLFVVDPRNRCYHWEVGEPIENPIVTEQDNTSPLMTHVRLDNVLMPAARQLRFSDPPRVLAGSLAGEPIYAEAKRSGGKCLVLSVDINEGDLAFRTAFPIMVTNALTWFAGQTGELRESIPTGSMTEVTVTEVEPRSAQEFQLRSPRGDVQLLRPRWNSSSGVKANASSAIVDAEGDLQLSIPPLDQCGIWLVVSAESQEVSVPIAQVAVNLANDLETDLRTPRGVIDVAPRESAAAWFNRPIWFYLTAAACFVAVTEWWLYQRRMIT